MSEAEQQRSDRTLESLVSISLVGVRFSFRGNSRSAPSMRLSQTPPLKQKERGGGTRDMHQP